MRYNKWDLGAKIGAGKWDLGAGFYNGRDDWEDSNFLNGVIEDRNAAEKICDTPMSSHIDWVTEK